MLALTGLSFSAMAVPAKRVNQIVRQSDGTELTIQLRGDETFHYYVTLDGTPVRQDANGDWIPDTRDLQKLHSNALAKRNLDRFQRSQKVRKAIRSVRPPYRADATEVQKRKGLVILVNFKDKAMKTTSSVAAFNQTLNSEGTPYGKNFGSVHEYFLSQSYGQLDLEFDIVGPYTLSQNMSYYGQDTSTQEEGSDAHPEVMISEACKMADAEVNFADYDWDGDGEVESVNVVYAGYSQASGASSNTIWPHEWSLSAAYYYNSSNSSYVLRLDGVRIDTYSCSSELKNTSGSTMDGVGTFCHEFSHCLGLPDFYDTQGSNFGMDAWSVMDYGCYNSDGFCPAGYTAYERWYSGWLEPVELCSGCKIDGMKDIQRNAEAYIIYNDKNKNEYYLLANHQLVEWDGAASGHGMMVLHVDYNQSVWAQNTVNNTSSRQRMTIIPADNTRSTATLNRDLWPSTRNRTELTDDSTPAATLYNSNTDGTKFMHKPITGIAESNGLISFLFMGGPASTMETPVLEEPFAQVETTGFTASWSVVPDAVCYNLQLTESSPSADEKSLLEAMNIFEDFEKFVVQDENATSDSSTDISASLDDYTFIPGWTGSKIYQGLFGAKLGSSSAHGVLTSPLVEGSTGTLTLYFVISDWFNVKTLFNFGQYKYDGSTVTVRILDASGSVLKTKTFTPGQISDDGEYFISPEPNVITFEGLPSEYKVSIESNKRIYAIYFMGFDGLFTQEEIESLFEEEVKGALPMRRQTLTPAARKVARRVLQTSEIAGVKTTSYTFQNLTPGYTYTLRVQAVDAEGGTSAWSDAVSVTLPTENVDVKDLKTETASEKVVFDVSGRRVQNPVRGGIYVIGGKKVFVK